jgi:hypothetical protein
MTISEDKQKLQGMVERASVFELELVWIPKIMTKQTEIEVRAGHTIEHNLVGLSGVDGRFISDIHSQIQRGKHLSEGQAKAVRRILKKYWKQYLGMMKPTIISGRI